MHHSPPRQRLDGIQTAREGGAVDVYVRCEGGLGRQRSGR